jgi:hypothetical protein
MIKREFERVISVKTFECERCGNVHETTERWGSGADFIFQCPEHGEFCNSLAPEKCGIFREVKYTNTDNYTYHCCCPECGWSPRIKTKPITEREVSSFKDAVRMRGENNK